MGSVGAGERFAPPVGDAGTPDAKSGIEPPFIAIGAAPEPEPHA